MRKTAFVLVVSGLLAPFAALAEEQPFTTNVTVTGKEPGPYSIKAAVKSKKVPYKMDRSKDITNEDLSRIINPGLPGESIDGRRRMIERGLNQMDEDIDAKNAAPTENTTASSANHPADTAIISDPVEEIKPSMDDATAERLEQNITKARADLQNATDKMADSNPAVRQQAIRDYNEAEERLRNLTNQLP